MSHPSYIKLFETGLLHKKISCALNNLKKCQICPRRCKVNREKDKGFCRTGMQAKVASYNAHFGEESPLVGSCGSGTIFFSNCNLGCLFCQNYEISHGEIGQQVIPGQLAAIMMSLQKQGCHNINLVTPSHVVPQILEALPLAIEKGLNIPIVYNSSGYDSLEALELLDGIIDIYMPDFKFWHSTSANKWCLAGDYPAIAKKAIKAMHLQVGDLQINNKGVAERGLLVRHLLMPEGQEETKQIINYVAEDISKNTYLNLMDQYRPCGQANKYAPLNRTLKAEEYSEAIAYAKQKGLNRLDKKDWSRFFRAL